MSPHEAEAHARRARSLVIGLCLSLIAADAAAQVTPATTCRIGGRVTSAGRSVPGVTVSVRQGDRLVESTSTGDDGRWVNPIVAGTYRLTFELRGFASEQRDASLERDCEVSLDVVLNIDAAAASRPPAGLDGAMRPTGNRTPGSSNVPVIRGREVSVNRAALRERAAARARGEFRIPAEETVLLGGPPSTTLSTAVAPPLPTGAPRPALNVAPGVSAPGMPRPTIQSNRLYSATASYTVAGSGLDAAPYQLRADAARQKPEYVRQSVDFTVGGPLVMPGGFGSPKTNATLSYSAIRGGNLFDQYATVPTAAMRLGDLSSNTIAPRDPLTGLPFEGGVIPAERIDRSAQILLTYLPLPNGSGSSRNFHYMSTSRSTQDTVNLKLTRPLIGTAPPPSRGSGRAPQTTGLSATLNAQIEFRRNVNDRLNALPSISGRGGTTTLRVPLSLNVTSGGTQHSAAVTFSRNVNETTNRYAGRLDVAADAGIVGASAEPFAWGIPALSFSTLTNVTDLTPTRREDRRLSASYSWSRGVRAHRIRLGGEFGNTRSANRSDQNARGSFVFTGLYSGSDFADFLLGQPQQATVQYGPGVVQLAGRSLSLYAQDEWRRWSNVTINAGLRYELVTPFTDPSGRLANLDVAPGFIAVAPVTSGGTGPFSGTFSDALIRADANNVAPRIGAAWRLAARTTLRVGYGVSFNTNAYSSLARQLSSQPPFAVTNNAFGTETQPLFLANALSTGLADTRNTFGVSRDYQAGVIGTWTIDLSRDLGDAWNVSAGITRASGSHLDIVRAPNRGPNGLLLSSVQPFLWQTAEGRSRLRSATLRVRRWYVRGFSTSLNYTLARSMDNASTIGGGATVVAQDEHNLAAEWGPSSFSRRHQLSGDLNFELPFGDDHRWLNRGGVAAVLLGRWSAYITFSAQTGTPLTARVLGNVADVSRGLNGTQRADLTGEPIRIDHPTADRFFNTAAFAVPQAGAFGTAGRNLIEGPGSRDVSVQLTRDLPAGRGRTVSVQLRASNVLNLVNFTTVDTAVTSPTFGQVLAVRPLRSMQLNVRWKF